MKVDLYPNEVVVKAGNTSYTVNDNKIPGKLIVTNQRVYFKSVDNNTSNYDLEINPDNISDVIYFGNGLFSSKGLDLLTNDGKSYRFPLKKRDEIGLLINSMY